jgi:membrane fusion protein, heavy metal efflux system
VRIGSTCALSFLLCWQLVGCDEPEAAEPALHQPPYRLVEGSPGRMKVRADLLSYLESVEATSSSVAADVVGFGHVEFAPGAAYAVRVPFDAFAEKVSVDLDDPVKKGDVLATLRSPALARLRAELENDVVSVRVEEKSVARLEPLVRDGTAAERDLVEARARLEAARARVVGAKSALAAAGVVGQRADRFTLRATASGRVLSRAVAPGERVLADGEPLFVIGNPEELVVRASFPERDALMLREGARCKITVHSLPGQELEGQVTRIVRSVDPKTRATVAICDPVGLDAVIGAKMAARVAVEVASDAHVVVPRSALLLRRDDPVVFVKVASDELERRVVKPGLQLGDRVQIIEGVSLGEEVVVSGAVLLDGELDVLL